MNVGAKIINWIIEKIIAGTRDRVKVCDFKSLIECRPERVIKLISTRINALIIIIYLCYVDLLL